MTNFLDIHTTAPDQLRAILAQATAMKASRGDRPKGTPDDDQPLKGHMVALIFEKPSTRTRISFDVGVRQMGGQTGGRLGSAQRDARSHAWTHT